jgi:hypothetical protein
VRYLVKNGSVLLSEIDVICPQLSEKVIKRLQTQNVVCLTRSFSMGFSQFEQIQCFATTIALASGSKTGGNAVPAAPAHIEPVPEPAIADIKPKPPSLRVRILRVTGLRCNHQTDLQLTEPLASMRYDISLLPDSRDVIVESDRLSALPLPAILAATIDSAGVHLLPSGASFGMWLLRIDAQRLSLRPGEPVALQDGDILLVPGFARRIIIRDPAYMALQPLIISAAVLQTKLTGASDPVSTERERTLERVTGLRLRMEDLGRQLSSFHPLHQGTVLRWLRLTSFCFQHSRNSCRRVYLARSWLRARWSCMR